MLRRTTLLLVVALSGLALACNTAVETPPREIATYSIQDFMGTTSYRGISFSPDNGKVLVTSDASGVFNVYAIPTAGGEPEALTTSTTESVFSLSYFPGDERFLFTADQGGNELNHVFVRELDGTETDLTPGDSLRASFLGWTRDRESFLISTNERDRRFLDVYAYSADTYERELIFQNDEGLRFADISPDGRYLAFAKAETNADSNMFLYDRRTSELKNLSPHEGDINFAPTAFSPDGKSLLFRTDEDSEFTLLARYDIESGSREVLERPDWDVVSAGYSESGRYLVVRINNDARTELRIHDTTTGDRVEVPSDPALDVTSVSFSRDDSWMGFYASGSRSPQDLFVYPMSGGKPTQLTRSLNPGIESLDLVDGEVVRFASFDGVEIPGILYRPHSATPENRAPALVWVHGGPGGQSRVGYSAAIQYLVNHGYAVYAINNRGSSGYGKTFFHLDDRRHGNEDLDDCVTSKRMLIDTGWVDPDRIGIIGGSYGGYMTLAALTFRPEEFGAGVDLFGISNWYRTVQSIPPWWEARRKALEMEMGPFDDEEFFRGKSPLFHAEQIRRPLMVLQGANDPRVLQVESDDIVAAVRENGVPVEYIVFEDEGHGFRKKENRERGYEAIRAFLDEHLKAAEAGTAG